MVVFAVEAKMACYSSASGPEPEIRAAKAWPGETSEMVMLSVAVAQTARMLIPFVLLAVIFKVSLAQANLFTCWSFLPKQRAVAAAACFSPHLFFRPPPSR